MESIQITEIKVNGKCVDIYFNLSKGLEKFFLPEHHFFTEYTFEVTDIPKSVLVVPLLLNLLPFSWLVDCVIWIDEIDEDFYNCIQPLKTAFRELHSNIDFGGTLIAAKRVKNSFVFNNQALQLFTGGVDATTTTIRIIDKKPILFNTNGWYLNQSDEENKVYDADVSAIEKIASSLSLKSYFVKSNFARFIISSNVDKEFCNDKDTTWWFGFQHSMAFIGCAMVAAYKFSVETVYIASSYTFGQYIICVSDPRIDNCIKCAGISTIHDGYELSRQAKVKKLVEYHNQSDMDMFLRVCSFNTKNCCECEKCFRSMLALIAEGADDLSEYGFYFEGDFLDLLKAFITKNAMELDSNHIVFWNDIIKDMKDNYENLAHKDVCDYLLNIDLEKARRNAILNHYKKDWKEIIKRKIFKI